MSAVLWLLSSPGVYKASEARLLLLMYQVNYVNQGNKLKDAAITPAKIIEDSWTMDGFVSGRFSYSRFPLTANIKTPVPTTCSPKLSSPVQVSAEPDGSSYVFQGFIQGKDYGQFGLQRLGNSRFSPC